MLRSLLAAVLVVSGCSAGEDIVGPIDSTDTPLPSVTPASVGLDPDVLDDALQQIRVEPNHDLHSFLVARNGALVVEAYFNGYGRDNPHDLRSATKSITSLLTGIAIERGAVASVEAPLVETLRRSYPQVQDKDGILVRHALTMSTGLDCDDEDRSTRGQEERMYRSRDWVAYVLSLSAPYAPGDTTRYCTGGVVALGEAIAQGAERDAAAFAAETLFEPLGVRNLRWARFDSDRKVDTGGHLLLTPQAMVKVGMLVAQRGVWGGRQVVPADWIARSTQPHTTIGGTPYGYLWWTDTARVGDRDVAVVWAEGNGGQKIYVVPELDLVAVFTAGYYDSDRARITTQLFTGAVLASVVEL